MGDAVWCGRRRAIQSETTLREMKTNTTDIESLEAKCLWDEFGHRKNVTPNAVDFTSWPKIRVRYVTSDGTEWLTQHEAMAAQLRLDVAGPSD